MKAEFYPGVNPELLPEYLKEMERTQVPFNSGLLFQALTNPAVKNVKVTKIQPGDVVTVDNVQKKVRRIDEHGEPVYEDLPKW